MKAWLKKWWGLVVGALVAVGAVVVAVLTPWRPRTKVPPRPKTPDVEVPEAPVVNTTPADDYEAEKERPKADGDEVIDDINRRYS